ncbi:CHASE2 domain-containing protein [Massilia arenosa]|uniref:CHASE2 domain-containing protein n=1 Tax=Zemynaea arenosa TaxID=2561931 RepID=A0A4Y9RX64_9BURK|nr:CHASE2 domain-containing protein [Massilia arenosa]TFW13730.1 CHASE2 domain-containing protein [Massilia arenosa]
MSDRKNHTPQPRSTARQLKECAIAIFVGCLLALTVHQFFGEEFATRQQARIYAPAAGEVYGEGARDQVRVLLIDDAALAAAGQEWPARYSYSARLLRALTAYEPKAVFFDIHYSARRDDPSLAAFTEQLCATRQAGIPLFLAAVRDRDDRYPLRPELDALDGRCLGKVAVRYAPDEVDRVAWSYPLAAAMPAGGAAALPPAAVALAGVAGVHPHDAAEPMALVWGNRAAAHGVGWADAHGERYCRPAHGWGELVPRGIRQAWFHDAEKPVCVYSETIRAGELLATSGEEHARLMRELKGKIVLVGLALSDSNDLVLSPIHGRVPGVYLHAMALDNLLAFHGDVPHDGHFSLDLHHWKPLAYLMLALVLVTLTPKLLKDRLLARHPDHWIGHPVEYLCARWLRLPPLLGLRLNRAAVYIALCALQLVLSLVLGCAMLLFGQYVLGLGVLSIVGVIFMTAVAEWTEFNETLTEHLLPEEDEEDAGSAAPAAEAHQEKENHHEHPTPVA